MATRTGSYKHTTARKFEGDDAASWAVFIKGEKKPKITGLLQSEVTYYRRQIEQDIEEAKAKKEERPTNDQIKDAFQQTAQSIASDIFQCCIDNGEDPVLPRECVVDYLSIHGGDHGDKVFQWVLDTPSEKVEEVLNEAGVPHTWE